LVVERLEPADFADRWGSRPDGGVAVGLRFISDAAEGQARNDAAREAARKYADTQDRDASVAEYNDELMARIVGAAICDPNDVSRDPEAIQFAEDTTRSALRSSTIARLFRRIEAMRIEHGAHAEADDDDLAEISDLLELGVINMLDESNARRARRYAAALLETLRL
jgi:hypothetical protein